MLKTLSDKQSTTPMESHVFEKCNPNKEFLGISHTPLPTSQNTPKIQNTKSTVGGLYTTNNDSSHNLLSVI